MKAINSIIIMIILITGLALSNFTFLQKFTDQQELIFPLDLRDCRVINNRLELTGWYNERRWYGLHRAYDISVVEDTPVIMPMDGTIKTIASYSYPRHTSTGWISGYGIYLDVEFVYEGRLITMRFAHLNKILKKENQEVKQGEVIALTGSTGLVNRKGITVYAPHLHIEVYENGVRTPFHIELGQAVRRALGGSDKFSFTLRR